ncbi:exopolysaccharide transport family protein [Pedobacter sandarakinus]|uniref:exopolysaccharide transport family protein n=1 Tax=Pedobacter sandarakinus TaxID=353156 RepID=UPI002246A5DF|nr:DEAD/DEAH box helicase family protein [Pedobacter sandarakinus]MCX2574873.1 lipopolysaccharide biosynthesis protein [Pedobacter sandarakinus]
MNFKLFLGQVLKYKWLLILLPIIALIVTFLLVRRLPKQYISEARISTGLLDPSKKVISNETVDFFAVNQQFANLVEKLTMKKMVNILSYNLVLHDLDNPQNAFKRLPEVSESWSSTDKKAIADAFRKKLLNKSLLTLDDDEGKYKLYTIANKMGYDEETLTKNLEVNHAGTSDLITVSYVSENPDLSAYVVNTLSTEFISNYSNDVSLNQNSSAKILDSLLLGKRNVMDLKNAQLSTFKKTKGVLNLNEQSATVYNQISVYEAQRAEALRVIQSNTGAIATIVSKLRGSDKFINGSSQVDNRALIDLKRQLQLANNAFIDGGFKASDQRKIDSLNRLLASKSATNIDENIIDPRASKQELVQQKLGLEIALQQARSSIRSIDSQLQVLRARYGGMVPYDADIANYERDAELATKDYMAALDRFNQSKTNQKFGLNLEIEQLGLPGNPKPSKKVLYLAGSGLGSMALCLGFIFLMVIVDYSIKDVKELEHATKSFAIGSLNLLGGKERNIRNIWHDKSDNKKYAVYKEQIRSIRFEIFNQMDADKYKILGITSLGLGAGKTFICYSLAYAFALTGKKVLLIADDLPYQASEEKTLTTSQSFQSFLMKKEFHTEDLITVMNKSSERNSLLEIQNVTSLRNGFDVLRKEFDYIIIDVNSLADVNISKEWLLFTEKNIAVFEYGHSIKENEHSLIRYIKTQPGFMGWILNKVTYKN